MVFGPTDTFTVDSAYEMLKERFHESPYKSNFRANCRHLARKGYLASRRTGDKNVEYGFTIDGYNHLQRLLPAKKTVNFI